MRRAAAVRCLNASISASARSDGCRTPHNRARSLSATTYFCQYSDLPFTIHGRPRSTNALNASPAHSHRSIFVESESLAKRWMVDGDARRARSFWCGQGMKMCGHLLRSCATAQRVPILWALCNMVASSASLAAPIMCARIIEHERVTANSILTATDINQFIPKHSEGPKHARPHTLLSLPSTESLYDYCYTPEGRRHI